ncbi:MAG TPA: hypothetical protein PK095_06105 [Myxococcota bacterium]|nr:hypothetical protein [Myxococcota bacterium]
MRSVVAVLLLMVMSAEARSELPPPHCTRDWWEPLDDVPTELTEVPTRPTLFLAAKIRWPFEGADPRLLEGLNIEVLDGSEAEVAGQLDWADYYDLESTLDGVLRWRPNAELVPGERYTLRLTVSDAPVGWEPYECVRRQGFTRTMEFTTASAPPEPPRLDVDLQVTRIWYSVANHGRCDAMEPDASCGDGSLYCCRAQHGAAWSLVSTIRLEGSLPPPLYTVVRARAEWPDGRKLGQFIHPAEGLRDLSLEYDGPFVELSSTDAFCTVVSVHSLMENDEVLANVRVCPEPDDIIYSPNPGPLTECDPAACARFGPRPEPEPEVVEPGSEVVEPGPEVVEPGPEFDGAETSADPDPERGASGCGSGPSGTAALIVGVLFSARRRRRRGAAHFANVAQVP